MRSNLTRRTAPILAAVIAVLLAAPVAAAHVTLNPREWEAGGFAKFDVRVPNERDNADTTRVVMRFPDEILSASFQDVPGWDRQVEMAQLDQPIEIEGEQITEKIGTVTWSGGTIEPGEFQEFGVSFQVPEDAEPGTALAFPSIQTYSNGERVRWIGPEESDEPAPTVTVLEAPPEEGEPAATETPAATPAPASAESEDEGGSDTLSIVALIVGALGLLAGGFALLRSGGRRKVAA
jgi:periplasmic copper chaperone A